MGSAEGGALDAIRPLKSGVWRASIVDAREKDKTYASGIYRHAQACLRLERSPGKYEQKILVSVLLTAASYTGFFIAPAAAPARVALGFLTFLMVMNNVDAVLKEMPDRPSGRDGGEQIWLLDFMVGTTIFNFFTLLEYGLMHHGLQVIAPGTRPSEPPAATGSGLGVKARTFQVFSLCRQWFWGQCAKLDGIMRRLFPIAYALFCVVMFALLPAYSTNEKCIYA